MLLVDIMKRRHLSQRQLAKRAGVQQNAVYRYLKGNRPSIDFAEKVSKALDYEISPVQIVWPDGAMTTSRKSAEAVEA